MKNLIIISAPSGAGKTIICKKILKEIKNINFSKDKTSNEIVRRGLLERIFGGVGTQNELPTSP